MDVLLQTIERDDPGALRVALKGDPAPLDVVLGTIRLLRDAS